MHPATVIALLALFVAVGGTAAARSGDEGPRATIAKAVGTRHLKLRSGSVLIKGAKGRGSYGSQAVEARCGRGETALSTGTSFSDDRPNRELSVVYDRLTVDGKGRPTGARARGAIDEGGTGFTVFVLCAG